MIRGVSGSVIERIKPGVWAQRTHPDFSPFAAVPYIVSGEQYADRCYVSLLSALALRGMIQQMPGSIHVMVTAQRRALVTPVARYECHRIDPAIFGGFTDFGTRSTFPLATPAKALFDTLLVSVAADASRSSPRSPFRSRSTSRRWNAGSPRSGIHGRGVPSGPSGNSCSADHRVPHQPRS